MAKTIRVLQASHWLTIAVTSDHWLAEKIRKDVEEYPYEFPYPKTCLRDGLSYQVEPYTTNTDSINTHHHNAVAYLNGKFYCDWHYWEYDLGHFSYPTEKEWLAYQILGPRKLSKHERTKYSYWKMFHKFNSNSSKLGLLRMRKRLARYQELHNDD